MMFGKNSIMQTAIFVSAILVLVTVFFIATRSRYRGFSCLRATGEVKERITRIEKRLSCGAGLISKKLHREICIFNSMKLVMACRNKVPVLYSQFLGRLVIEPRWVIRGSDAFMRLLYVCAAVNLYANSCDPLVRRQIMKNCLYVFGQKDIIKSKRNFDLVCRKFTVHKGSRFKYLGGKFILEQNRTDSPSYCVYKARKHYADKLLPAQCFETNEERFSYLVSNDKFGYNLTHTADTFFAVGKNDAVGLYVPDKVTFGSSICERGNDLVIYASSENGKYYIINGKNKTEITATVAELKRRRGALDYLKTTQEAKESAQIEQLFERAWSSRFIHGERLKQKFSLACKFVPTLFLPSLVYTIDKPDDFFGVVDNFGALQKIAKTGNSINVIFLYSSYNDEVREIIKNFADKDVARELIAGGVFLFFVDRLGIDADALNYLSLMSELKLHAKDIQISNNKSVEVVINVSNSFPVTHTVYARNALKKPQGAVVGVPLDVGSELDGLTFGMPAICSRKGALLQVTSLKSGRSASYKLPNGANATDEFGREIGEGEIACEKVYISCSVSLSGFEEKTFKIIKGEGGLSRNERKQAFLGSLEDLHIKGDSKLQRLFEMEKTMDTDEKLVTNLKNAIKNAEKDVFFALLKNRDEITEDVYTLLIERVVGIKLLRGRIQLTPCIAFTGSFELSFTHKGTPYKFSVTERGGGFAVNYGGAEFKNFFELPVTAN
jgi:hypothetical protein